MKKLLVALALLLVVIGGGLFLLGSNLEPLIKAAVEKYGPEVIKASVKLDGVKLSPTDGKGTVSGLTIGNPAGFSTANAFYLGSIEVQIEPKSTMGDGPIIIKEIAIIKPEVTYEVAENGENNLSVIAKNAQSNTAKQSAPNTAQSKEKDTRQSGRRIIIDKLSITGGKITVSHKLLNGKALDVAMPSIEMSKIGRETNGITSDQLASLLISQISASAGQAAKNALAQNLGSVVNKQLEKVVPSGLGQPLKGLFGK